MCSDGLNTGHRLDYVHRRLYGFVVTKISNLKKQQQKIHENRPKWNESNEISWRNRLQPFPGHFHGFSEMFEIVLVKIFDLIINYPIFTDHFGWMTTKYDVKHSIEFITSLMKMKFPNKPIVMVIGNHDIHPSDAYVNMYIEKQNIAKPHSNEIAVAVQWWD